MSYLLTEDQQLIQKNARDFATQYLEPLAVQLDKTGEFPAEVVKKMASHDFLGWFLPVEFGGAEFGYVSYVLGVEELSRASAAVASIVVNHSSAAYAINRWGTAEQKKKYLPALAKGEKLGAVAMSEPGPGVGQGPEAVIATQQADGYVLNGRKSYVANAGVADLYVVFGCTDRPWGPRASPHSWSVRRRLDSKWARRRARWACVRARRLTLYSTMLPPRFLAQSMAVR